MGLRKLLSPLAMMGCLGVSIVPALAGEGPTEVDVQALITRLDAAEKEITELKAKVKNQEAKTQLYSHDQLGVRPASTEAAQGDELTNRVSSLEGKLKAQEEKAATTTFPTHKLIGRVHADSVWTEQDSDNEAAVGTFDGGANFRRARIGVEGMLFENSDYRIEVDFAGGGRPTFTDVYTTIKELPTIGNVRIGHFKEPFSLEELTSSRFMTFMERATLNEFAPQRELGIMAFNTYCEDAGTWAIGWFKTESDDFGDDVGDGENAVTMRLTTTPYYDEGSGGRYLVHVGAAYSFRDSDEGLVEFDTQPEMRLRAAGEGAIPNFVDTGPFVADNHQLFGAETAVVWGPLSAQSEYVAAVVNSDPAGDPNFHGVYVYVSYFLTGENRAYNRQAGTFDRVKPLENFFAVCTEDDTVCCGWGAWELKARWSYIDLDDGAINGGRMSDWTFGVNWYLNSNFHIMLDYVHADFDDDAVGDTNADFLGMRAAIDW